jgi:hypothetical protein
MSVGSLAYDVGDGIVRRIRALGPRTECVIVVGVAFGMSIASSLLVAFGPARSYLASRPLIAETVLWQTACYELVLVVALGSFLGLRGWTLSRIGLAPFSLKAALAGPVLAVLAYIVTRPRGWLWARSCRTRQHAPAL